MAAGPEMETLIAGMPRTGNSTLEHASGTAAGLARIEASAFDLLVLDITGLGAGGVALLHRIRQMRPGLRVLVVAGETDPATVIHCLREQAYGYFSKPYLKSAVEQFIRQALASHARLDEIEVLSARPEWIAIRICCRPETAERLIQFLREMAIDLPPGEREDLATALHEVIMNSIEHGANSDPGKELRVACLRSSRSIIYHVEDPGPGFKLDELLHAAISNDPDSPAGHLAIRTERGIRPGGFGILMARNLVDELIYNEKGNEVVLIKYLKESQPSPEAGLS